MKKRIIVLTLIVALLLFASCKKDVQNVSDDAYEEPTVDIEALMSSMQKESEDLESSTEESVEESITEAEAKENAEFIKEITYSNLKSDEVKKELIDSLKAAGIAGNTVKSFIGQVVRYNETVGDVGLTEEGFVKSENLIPEYDVLKIDEKWLAKNPEFIGYDCRLTSFLLLGDMITVENPSSELSPELFMDNDAIDNSGNSIFTEERIQKFNTIFAGIPAKLSKDVSVHVEEAKEYMKKSGILFKDSDASLISVYLHSDLDNNIFVGHAGVLLPSVVDDSLLFIEKISFQEPYQVLKLNNRQELNDYLMNKYDNWMPPETARPFIMENDELLDGYRLNVNIK